jgi:3-oxoacyl-[acyl-carrier protein] reductase
LNIPLDGQTVLVTGATGGIGASVVEQLALEGARVIIHYGRDQAKAEALLDRIGGNGATVQADLSTVDGASRLWRGALEATGRIHGLVNNAGIRTEVTVDASDDDWRSAWEKEFRVNFFAAADLCREAIKHFRDSGGGRIVNMTSRAGQRGYAANAMPYGAAKAALANLTKSIARSFGADAVTAVNIAPGWVRTDMAEDFIEKHGKSAAVADIPIGEMATPQEVAELVSFVLRRSQASLNGATLDVNGGSYIR